MELWNIIVVIAAIVGILNGMVSILDKAYTYGKQVYQAFKKNPKVTHTLNAYKKNLKSFRMNGNSVLKNLFRFARARIFPNDPLTILSLQKTYPYSAGFLKKISKSFPQVFPTIA